jgi:hypothetical protein
MIDVLRGREPFPLKADQPQVEAACATKGSPLALCVNCIAESGFKRLEPLERFERFELARQQAARAIPSARVPFFADPQPRSLPRYL